MKRILTIWATLGAAYVVFETLFRGYSHPSMFVVGGLCGVLVGTINQDPRFYRAPVIVQSVIGAVIVLAGRVYFRVCTEPVVRGWVFGFTAISRETCWAKSARRSACCGSSLCRLLFGRRTQRVI